MNSKQLWTATACFAAAGAGVLAQGTSGSVAPASPGLVNDWLREQQPATQSWDLGGQVRVRYEHRENYASPGYVDFESGAPDNSFWLLREKVHLGYKSDWFGAYVEGRDSSTHEDRRNPNPEADTFDLHQGYLILGNAKEFPVTAKIGRQELSYGDERLIGAFDWNNIGRVFDAAKLRFESKALWVDAFAGRVILPDDDHFNEPNDYDWVSGVYASTGTLIPKQTTDVYFLARNVESGSTREITSTTPSGGVTSRDVYTLGVRFKSAPKAYGAWDYEGELAGQFGNFAMTAAGESLDHLAFATHVAGGYTFADTYGQPRLGLEYNFASGDSDPNDGEHNTFENLFPTNHKFYGYMDFFSWQNMHNARLTASVKPHGKVTLTADYHAFWLADSEDYFYQVNGAPRRGAYGINADAGNYVGSEIDLVATWAATRFASFQGGYGHFFAGDYVKDSLGSGRTSDADFVYVQALVNF